MSKARTLKAECTPEEARQQRVRHDVELRKSKKSSRLRKLRHIDPDEDAGEGVSSCSDPGALMNIVAVLASSDPNAQAAAVVALRRTLSTKEAPPIDAVLASGVLPHLVTLLKARDRPDLQFESAWALTNLAAGTTEQTELVAASEAPYALVELLRFGTEDCKEQALWALGNLAGENARCRDHVLGLSVIEPMLQLAQSTRVSMLRNMTRTLLNLARGTPPPALELVVPAVPLVQQLTYAQDEDLVSDACWTLACLTDNCRTAPELQAVVSPPTALRLVELLGHLDIAVRAPALRSLGNVCTGDVSQVLPLLDAGLMRFMDQYLRSSKKEVRVDTCYLLTAVASAGPAEVKVIVETNLVPLLLSLAHSGDFESGREAACCLAAAGRAKDASVIATLISLNIIPALVLWLDGTRADSRLLLMLISSLYNMIKHEPSPNAHANLIQLAGCRPRMEQLLDHENVRVSQAAGVFVDKHIPDDV
mmetsp:Transcript_6713/g.15479  ORF Transcript_6713/g.15479 Transcript_6713/m.15479 type:complete len:479 (+) Transcript_6713:24-1460(+)